MNRQTVSLSTALKILACLALDAAALVFFVSMVPVLLLSPVKSVFILLVMLISLAVVNGLILFSRILFHKAGVVYGTFTLVWSLLYTVTANVVSIFLIAGSTLFYVFLQLIFLAVFLGVSAVIVSFAKRSAQEQERYEEEQFDQSALRDKILHIETELYALEREDGIQSLLHSFKILKERINASTPFGRSTGNTSLYDIENKIKDKLDDLLHHIKFHSVDKDIPHMQKLVEEIRRLVKHRETLNIK